MEKTSSLYAFTRCIADIDAIFERCPTPSLEQACEAVAWERHGINPAELRDAIHVRALKAANLARHRANAKKNAWEALRQCFHIPKGIVGTPIQHRDTQDATNFIMPTRSFDRLIHGEPNRYSGFAFTGIGSARNGVNLIRQGEQAEATIIHETRHQRDSWLMQQEEDPQIKIFKEETLAFLAEEMPVTEIISWLIDKRGLYKAPQQNESPAWHTYCQKAVRAICSAWHRHRAKGTSLDALSLQSFQDWALPNENHILRVHRTHISGFTAGTKGISDELSHGGHLPHQVITRILETDLKLEAHKPFEHKSGIWISFVRGLHSSQGYHPMVIFPAIPSSA